MFERSCVNCDSLSYEAYFCTALHSTPPFLSCKWLPAVRGGVDERSFSEYREYANILGRASNVAADDRVGVWSRVNGMLVLLHKTYKK